MTNTEERLQLSYFLGKDVHNQVSAPNLIQRTWVLRAQKRYIQHHTAPRARMTAIGIDVARFGNDHTAICYRYHNLVAPIPLLTNADSHAISNAALLQQKDGAYFVIDVGGVGVGVYDVLKRLSATAVYSYTANAKATDTCKNKFDRFTNLRTQLWWKLREALEDEQFGFRSY